MKIQAHEKVMEQVKTAIQAGRFPQAVLLDGPAGIGKKKLALDVAALLGCTGLLPPCGECFFCRHLKDPGAADRWIMPLQLEAKDRDQEDKVGAATTERLKMLLANPWQLRIIEPSAIISVSQIRQLWGRMGMKTQGVRVMIIPEADCMNVSAANALLKTLEEVPAQTYFILTSSRRSRLLQTIQSRCMPLRVETLRDEEIRDILQQYELGEPSEDLLGLALGSVGKAMACLEYDLQELQGLAYQLLVSLEQGEFSALFRTVDDALEKDLSKTLFFLEVCSILAQDTVRLGTGQKPRFQSWASRLQEHPRWLQADHVPQVSLLLEQISLGMRRLEDKKGSIGMVIQNMVLSQWTTRT